MVPQGGDVTIAGSLSASGGSIANAGGKPTSLTIYGCGPSTTNWSITGGTASYYAVYAPNHPLAISGGSDLYGAFVAASVSVSGGAPIHYDEALGRSSMFTLVPGSWTEVSR